MKFLENIEDRTLLIIPNDFKVKILEEINKCSKLINIKIMTLKEFLDHYFYTYDLKTISYVIKNYNLSYKNSKMYLDNMKYVLDLDFKNKKVDFLKNLYQDLTSKKLLIFDNLFKEYLKNINIKVLEINELEEFYLKIFREYKAEFIKLPERSKVIPNIYKFKTIEDECNYLFNDISSKVKSGISLNKIKLINAHEEYLNILKRMSNFYNIKISSLDRNNILGTIACKNIIDMIESNQSQDYISEYLSKNLNKDIYRSIFNVLNKYSFVNDLKSVIDLIKEDFKNTYIKEEHYEEEIEIIPLNSYLLDETCYAYLIGFNLENIPKTYKDNDYLNDFLKEKIGLFTSLEKNIQEASNTLFHIKNIPNLVITYKDRDPYKNYYPSNLIEELGEAVSINSVNLTSNIYNQIKLTNDLDMLLKYGVSPSDKKLLNTYKDIPYLTYNNKYQNINSKISNIVLSYTSLNNFYHCSFKYYIESILKLNIYEDNFKLYIGNLFHFVLSKMFCEDFDFEVTWNSYIKEKNFSKKEEFYLKILKEELIKIIEIIKYQHSLSEFKDVKLECEVNIPYQDNTFKGVIDKIMYKEKDNNTYIALVDYKTGTPKTNMTNLIYGIDMQLPIYVYLVSKSNLFLNPKIVGFYFQKIISEVDSYNLKKDLEKRKHDKLELDGYSIEDEELVKMFDKRYEND